MNEKLFLELKRRRLHQYELAGLAKISETTLTRILYGRVKPTMSVKRRIAKALGRSVDELFGNDNHGPMTAISKTSEEVR